MKIAAALVFVSCAKTCERQPRKEQQRTLAGDAGAHAQRTLPFACLSNTDCPPAAVAVDAGWALPDAGVVNIECLIFVPGEPFGRCAVVTGQKFNCPLAEGSVAVCTERVDAAGARGCRTQPQNLTGSGAPGSDCKDAVDCVQTCCNCASGAVLATTCSLGKCLTPPEVCTRPEVCAD